MREGLKKHGLLCVRWPESSRPRASLRCSKYVSKLNHFRKLGQHLSQQRGWCQGPLRMPNVQLGQQLEMTKEIAAGMLLEFLDGYKGHPNFVPKKCCMCPKPLVLQKYTQLFHEKVAVAVNGRSPPVPRAFMSWLWMAGCPNSTLFDVAHLAWSCCGQYMASACGCVYTPCIETEPFRWLEWVEMGESEAWLAQELESRSTQD